MWSVTLAWRIEFEEGARRDLAKLDKSVAKRVVSFLRERLAILDNPRSIGSTVRNSHW
mgnify:CR=1 FL=1